MIKTTLLQYFKLSSGSDITARSESEVVHSDKTELKLFFSQTAASMVAGVSIVPEIILHFPSFEGMCQDYFIIIFIF